MQQNHVMLSRRTVVAGASAIAACAAASALAGRLVAFGDEVGELQAQIADKQAEADSVSAQLATMQDQLDRLSDSYNGALMAQRDAHEALERVQADIDATRGDIAATQAQLSVRVRALYRDGSTSIVDVLMGSSSFQELATGLDLLTDLSESDARLVAQLKDQRTRLESLRAEHAVHEQEAAQAAAEAEEAKRQAERTLAQLQAVYDGLSGEVAELVARKREAEEAAAAAAAAEAEAARRAAQRDVSAGQPDDSGGGWSGGADYDEDDGYDDEPWGASGGYTGGGSYDHGSLAVSRAESCLGLPYDWAAVGPDKYDCSGLVGYCLTGEHERVFTSASLMGYPAVADPQPGDVAVKDGHTGIYIGDGLMIHAADYGLGVIVGPVQSEMKIVRP